MKLSTFNWLSGAITLPLFIATLNLSPPVGAEQIDRSRSRIGTHLSTVTDLNLTIPIEVTVGSEHNRRQSSSKRSTSSNSKIATINLSGSPSKEQSNKFRSTSKQRVRITTNTNSASDRSHNVKSVIKNKTLILAKIATPEVIIPKNGRRSKSNANQNSRAIAHSSLSGNYLLLVRYPDRGTNDIGNPIYTLETYIDGELDRTFSAVTGTANSQKADRNLGNNHAPLPDGLYDVNNWIVPGTLAEVGKTFIGISPKFKTNRDELGIHLDPSFNQRNGYDGTSGCIGLTTSADRDAINDFVAKYRPRNLFVKISPTEERE